MLSYLQHVILFGNRMRVQQPLGFPGGEKVFTVGVMDCLNDRLLPWSEVEACRLNRAWGYDSVYIRQ